MPRTVKEWIGANDDTKIPPRVKQRVANGADHRCENCRIRITTGGEVDHRIALINGGENREQNLRLLCRNCHREKTRTDLATKSHTAKAQKKLGPLKREQSAWSKRYEAMKELGYNPWNRSLPRPHRNGE